MLLKEEWFQSSNVKPKCSIEKKHQKNQFFLLTLGHFLPLSVVAAKHKKTR